MMEPARPVSKPVETRNVQPASNLNVEGPMSKN